MYLPVQDIIPLSDIVGRSDFEQHERLLRKINMLVATNLASLLKCYNNLSELDGIISISFDKTSDNLIVKAEYDDGKSWDISIQSDEFNKLIIEQPANKNLLIALRTAQQFD